MGEGSKRCTKCGETKPLEVFRLTGRATSGKRYRASECKVCHAAEARAYRAANLEAVRARELAYSRANGDANRERARRWYAENRERGLARAKRQYQEKPEQVIANVMKANARKRGATETETFTRDEIIRRDLGRCHVCGEPVNPNLPRHDPGALNLDHVVPLTEGGAHTRANVRVAHFACNLGRRPLVDVCPQGHIYDEANTYWRKDGGRSCRACAREKARGRRLAQKGSTLSA